MSIADKIREAREWGKCVDTLKASVDSMYDICRTQQNILGCEEAIMFLKHAIRDFHCLVDTIKIEQNWESSEERPMISLAWEIRGSTVSRNSLLQKKEKECQTQNEKVHQIPPSTTATMVEAPVPATAKPSEGEWQIVQRQRRKSSISSRQNSLENWTAVPFGRPSLGLVKAPKSAMDLPQTKASMAKMAYSRQLLSEKSLKEYMEKLNSNRRRKQPTTTANELVQSRQYGGKIVEAVAHRKPPDIDEDNVVAVIKRQCSEPPPDCLKMIMDKLSDDCEWRAMTEEEESLAQEEESLKKEIEIEEEENLPPFEDEMETEEQEQTSNMATVADVVDKSQQQEKDTANASCGEKETPGPATTTTGGHYRNPGELAQLRAKLMSPTKRRRVEEMDSENKLKRAEELRTEFQRKRSQRLQLLHQRVEEVRLKREEIQQKKLAHLEMLEQRIRRAEENRLKGQEEIVERAQEEELKIMEINLLNSFEAANHRLEKRYTQIREKNRVEKQFRKAEEKRQKKIEENKQQKMAAEQRRKDAEEQRTKRLKDQADQQQQRQCHALKHRVRTMEKYKARVAQHNQRISQRKANELAEKQQLLDKIQQKHDKRTENYEQCKEQVRRRAMGLCSPRPCHLWAQSLADFGQAPSDTCLHFPLPQRPYSSNLDQQSVSLVLSTTKILSKAVDNNPVSCWRCKTKIHSDLQLVSHVLSDQHLKTAGLDEQAILNISDLNYDFLRNEFGRIIGAAEDQSQQQQPRSFAATELLENNNNNELNFCLPQTPAMTDSLSSTEIPLSTASTNEQMALPPSMEQLLARSVDLFVEDAKLKELLGTTVDEQQQQQNNSAAAKKKRTKLRQKFLREFESFDQPSATKNSNLISSNFPRDLKRALNDALAHSKEICTKAGPIAGNDLQPVERALIELTKAVQQTQKEQKDVCPVVVKAMKDSDLFGQLMAVCIRIEQHRLESTTKSDQKSMNKQLASLPFSRFIQKSLRLLVLVIEATEDAVCFVNPLTGKAMFDLCDLFRLNAQKIHSQSNLILEVNRPIDVEPKYTVLSILHIITRLVDGNKSPKLAELLFTNLCVCCSLISHLAHCARSESGELCAELQDCHEMLGQGRSPITICQVVTDFLGVFVTQFAGGDNITDDAKDRRRESSSCCGQSENGSVRTVETQLSSSSTMPVQQQNGNSSADGNGHRRTNNFEKLRLSCLLWLYSLTIHAYQQSTGQSQTLPVTENTSPDEADNSPTANNPNPMTCSNKFLPVLAGSFIRIFNALGSLGNGLIQAFLELEKEQMLATRVAFIFRAILQMEHDQRQQQKSSIVVGNGKGADESLLLLRECIAAIGHFAKISPKNQLLCVFGWQRSILTSLCFLPLDFVLNAPNKHFLLPSLCIILFNCQLGLETIRGEFCLHYLIEYIKVALHSRGTPPSSSSAAGTDDFKLLAALIPPDQWESAKQYFESNNTNNNANSTF